VCVGVRLLVPERLRSIVSCKLGGSHGADYEEL
jgi:hypothetical protein